MNKNKKLLTIICHNLYCGGTEKVITNLINYYSSIGIETTIITLGPAKLFSSFKLSKKTNIIELRNVSSKNIFKKLFNILDSIFTINKYMKDNKESIYLSFLTTPNILTVLSSFNRRINHYGSERNNPKYINLSIHWKLLRFITYPKMNYLIVQTKEIKKYFSTFVPKRKIRIIPNSIKKYMDHNKIKIKNSKKLRILFIGRLEYQKGIDVLLDSIIKIFNSECKDRFIFEIVGDGTFSELVEDTIKKYNLERYLKFTKGTDKPYKFIKNCNIVLHPSRYEGMSNVVLEAMACGKCVISTYQSSSEIITNNKNGILMKSVSAIEIINCLEKVSMNKVLLKDIGLNAINTINNNYSEEKIFSFWSKTLKIN